MRWLLVGVIGLGLLGGCDIGNSASPAASYPDCPVGRSCAALADPGGAVSAWFDAIQARDVFAARALFLPASADQTDWVANAPKNAFNHVSCRQLGRLGTTATFYCTFQEAPGNWSGNRDTFWNIYLQKTSAGKWLIDGYGQG